MLTRKMYNGHSDPRQREVAVGDRVVHFDGALFDEDTGRWLAVIVVSKGDLPARARFHFVEAPNTIGLGNGAEMILDGGFTEKEATVHFDAPKSVRITPGPLRMRQ